MSEKKHASHVFRGKSIQWIVILTAILIYISFYIPVPYFISMPGSAIELDSVVEVENGFEESGSLMLTTISILPARLPGYLYSFVNQYMDLTPKEYILNEDEEPEAYSKRQIKVMKESQDNSIIAAFKFLNLPIEVMERGVLVMGLIPNLPSEKVLKIGDLIVEADNLPIKTVEELLAYIGQKEEGDFLKITFIRDGKTYTEHIPLVNLSKELKSDEIPEKKLGIGFYPYQERKVIPSKKVIFKTEEIGGPSAGLMFTLEIINQLTQEDLTRGYQIAGTGTINSDGMVGPIGGARLKVKAAYSRGAEIFFVPADVFEGSTNQSEAEQANVDLGSPLKIVPVRSLEEAVDYLRQLEEKAK